VRGLEGANLQVDHEEPPQPAVVKEQVDVEILAVDDEAFLPGDEGEAGAQLEDELLEFAEDGGLHVLLAVCVGQAEEVKEVGVAEDEVGREYVVFTQVQKLLPGQLGGLAGEGRALEEHALDLGPQGA